MKNKNIFRMTSVLLISILCVCGLSLNAYASDGGEYYSTVPTEATTTPPVIVIPAESEDGEQTGEPIIKPENAFTPDGNMTLIDNVEGEDEGQKQFIIVRSKNGHYFYIVIDYSTEGENTVHFLNQVDEADLMAILAEEEITLAPAECTCTDKCAVGDIDTTCPVCIATMTECAGAEATPPADETDPPADDTEQPAPSGLNMGVIIAVVVVIALAGGGIFCYFKVLKPKQQKNKQPQGAELSELEYDEYDEDEEYTEALEDIADKMNYDTDDTEDTEE